ncbi:BNR repeat-containing protein [Marinimicrobium agarilyticum]|uniref:BNR repeat-containing protein n=1 Tax=Marinimicrobium agarilyticum TaxID=306546 RepID=UPI000686BA9D|nr:BNR repeat-containing protein [Marinimicrobium agarilyticum]
MCHTPFARFARLLLVSVLFLALLACQSAEPPVSTAAAARQIPIIDAAYAGSSVNVVAGSRQTLFTDQEHQYAGFYDAAGQLTLAKRRLGETQWQVRRTGYTTAVQDAHNTVSLVVDGQGYLHVAWGHHNTPLQYAVSQTPGALSLGAPVSMLGRTESSVTYPQFYRTADGGLLFLYREGGSGNGRLVLNRFDPNTRQWQRLQSNLIDGEGERSAYWDMTIDSAGGLHLAWVWRETPDVASNHDLLYAYSPDGGRRWERSDGTAYSLPITMASAEVAVEIPQSRNLMNPPVIATDARHRPYISSYWSATEGERPRFSVVYQRDGGWLTRPGPMAGRDFELKGWGTKRPPISRAALLVETGETNVGAHLIYRDDSLGGRVVLATFENLGDTVDKEGQAGRWLRGFLTEDGVGAWEPSVDPTQWHNNREAHLLLQDVDQIDGNDRSGSDASASPLKVLIWEAR